MHFYVNQSMTNHKSKEAYSLLNENLNQKNIIFEIKFPHLFALN